MNRELPISCKVQRFLCKLGVAVHNPFRNECTEDFGCCTSNGHYWLRLPQRGLKKSRIKREYADQYARMVADALRTSSGTSVQVDADAMADIVRSAILNAVDGMKYPRKIKFSK